MTELPLKVQWHKQTLGLVQQYGRKNLVSIIGDVHNQLFTLPQHQSFQAKDNGFIPLSTQLKFYGNGYK
jgi:hypothetical protein